jgi:uridine phosphorylase
LNTEHDNAEEPLIRAEKLIYPESDGLLGEHKIRKALLAFMPVGEMKHRFLAKRGRRIFLSYYWSTWVREDGAILAGPIFGGPMCAAALEELSALGVEDVIGYGYSGALDPEVRPACIMVADSGFCSDGTSKEYCEKDEILGDAIMLEYLRSIIQKHGIIAEAGKVWTTDAIYRESPSKIRYWRGKGARFVNIETSSLYSVARVKGIRAAYTSVISDSLAGDKWSGWYNCRQAVQQLWDICLDAIENF